MSEQHHLANLRIDLHACNYTELGLLQLLGEGAYLALGREQTVPAERAIANNHTPLATVAKLFSLGQTVSLAAATAAFPNVGVSALISLGLFVPVGAQVRASAQLVPAYLGGIERWLISDFGQKVTKRALSEEHVMGFGGASKTLANLMLRAPMERVLDLGTGSGALALALAPSAKTVVASDISPQALRYANLNAALNDCAVELVAGSLLEPFAGEKFDLIVSNPPFVISPANDPLPKYTYRSVNTSGDELLRGLLRDLPNYLQPGGVAQLLGNWEISGTESWDERLRNCFQSANDLVGSDIWVIQRQVLSVEEYCETWLRDAGINELVDADLWKRAYESRLDDFFSRGVTQVGFGYVTIRKPSQERPAFHRFEELTYPLHSDLSDAVAYLLNQVELHYPFTTQQLLDSKLLLSSDVIEVRDYTPGQEDPRTIKYTQQLGFQRTLKASTGLATIMGACDGELTLQQILGGAAFLLERDATDLAAEVIPQLSEIILDGFLSVTE